jgi:tellurite resistance protein
VTVQTRPEAAPGLAHLPMPLLTVPMGIGGLGLAWRQATDLGAPVFLGEALLLLAALSWLLVVGLHALRFSRHPASVVADLRNPVGICFAAAPTIGLMILSAGLFPYLPGMARLLWAVAVVLHLLAAMVPLRRIVTGRAEAAMIGPPLLIPFVGNIVAPIFGPRMGFVDASWAMFGVGLLLWLAALPLILHRMVAGPKLPPPLLPSLAILLAAPAAGAAALIALTGSAGGAAMALTGVALLVAAVLVSMAGDFAKVPFGPAWWGFTFPSAIFAALLAMAGFPALLCWTVLLGSTAIVGYVALRTLEAAGNGTLLRPVG